ncbi:MAG: type VI secretion system tip protein VgrG, partial [Sandaracinaceae bacterium]|nr:type VI secretion system tip protein VgrG [Sandaracinaceae bacterium]
MLVEARLAHQDLPADVAVVRARVREGLSELFDVEVIFVTQDGAVDLGALLWSGAALTLTPAQATDSAPRSFHGMIEEASYLGFDRTYYRYRLRLRPQIHGLAYRVRTRIFQNKNAVDIIKQVFTDAGIPDAGVVWDTAGDYPVREYCTQWKESELAFVLRLLEEEGIFYWFEHTETDHVLHLGDAPDVHVPIEGDSTLRRRHHADQVVEGVWDVVHKTRLTHDAVKTRDWHFTLAAAPLESNAGEEGGRRRYEYPGGYAVQPQGGRLTNVRFEEERAGSRHVTGASDCLRLMPGRRVTLSDVEPVVFAEDWIMTRLEQTFAAPTRADAGALGVGEHSLRFVCIPAETPFRPPRNTPRPKAYGLESAVVTGPSGEEIHVDEFGRIKVHFYWDRENPVDDTASCWIRVQQLNTSGAMILPRIGWEMHVAFLDGD